MDENEKRIIRRAVARAFRKTIVDETEISARTYSSLIVPSAPLDDGFGANEGYWSYILGFVKGNLDEEYRVYSIDQDFAQRTLNEPVRVAIGQITAKIIKELEDEEAEE